MNFYILIHCYNVNYFVIVWIVKIRGWLLSLRAQHLFPLNLIHCLVGLHVAHLLRSDHLPALVEPPFYDGARLSLVIKCALHMLLELCWSWRLRNLILGLQSHEAHSGYCRMR